MAVIAIIAVIVVSSFAVGVFVYPATKRGEYSVTPSPPSPVPSSESVPNEGSAAFIPGLLDVDRKIIYNAWISIEVQDVNVATSHIQAVAEEFGGYVSQMSVLEWEDVKTGLVTVRVPQADFNLAIERFELLGEVKDKNVGSDDVTERYVDLEARLKNAERQEQRLLEILDQASEVEDILNIERELGRIREQIEIYMGQLTYLDNRIEYATITVTLAEPNLPAPLPDIDWDAAVKNGIWGLFVIVQGLIILAFVIIPPIVIGVPIYYIYRRQRRK